MPTTFPFDPALRARIATNLAEFQHRPVDDAALRHAGVVIVVVKNLDDDGASVLLTKRPEGLRRHAGQFALPGGRLDGRETAEEAALRELHEELGLTLDAGDILGQLDDFPTRSGFRITPIVAWGGEARELKPDPVEVARVFRIPLTELNSPAIPRLEPAGEGLPPVMSAPLPAMGSHVYAPTAAILYQFREVALNGRPTRVAHFGQPRFAWR
jgi:8-oxo-dGTP pyrophosphatase MutT (NUDIX family)